MDKKIVYETHNEDEWKIVYKRDDIFPYRVTVYLKRKNKKFWQREYKKIDYGCFWNIRQAEEKKDKLIDEYYCIYLEESHAKEFFGGSKLD